MSVWLFLTYAATNTLRLLGGLWLAGRPGGGAGRRVLLLAVPAGCLFAALQGAGVPAAGVLAAETLLLAGLAWRRLRRTPELCLLFAFLYELGTTTCTTTSRRSTTAWRKGRWRRPCSIVKICAPRCAT